ncbi:MAG: serine/threonine protein kinase [Chlamydiales bacterium 38-26]|nr:SUMF1/EgtB/PvdO family nonheme iron enzyme [Chlamydiales bacterium]OJV09409.1 MAG: serine/threonine protein kinase [Chlamydiales bacterium 38-26]
METRVKEAKILGDYTVVKQIGQGSLGNVYLAEHRFMKKHYILKVLPEELSADRSFIQRFEEDISNLSTLDHPHIVKIHNVSYSHGQYFLVTDCVVDEMGETTNLMQYVLARGKRLEEEELLRLLKQIAQALDYAHDKKLVHRGLKLNNILVSKKTGSSIDLNLSDFGLSRIVGVGAVLTRTYKNVAEALGVSAAIATTKTGQERYAPSIETQKLLPLHASFLQNYVFLAPEQKRLDSSKIVDARADRYAFGILAYYLLMQEFPEGIFEMPSDRHDYRWNWDLLIQNCLQSEPAKRPESLLEEIEKIQSPKPQVKTVQPSLDVLKIQHPSSQTEEVNAGTQRVFNIDETQKSSLKPILKITELERPQTDPDPAAIFQLDTSVKSYKPEYKEVKNIQPLLTDMVVIPGGVFYRGSNDGNRDEVPRHQISLSSYAIDIHPVTNEQFVRFLEIMGGEKDSNHQDIIRLRDSRIKRSGGKLSIESGYAKHPVVGVTWYGAVAYAKWVGKRLPTEAEWEIAARGGMENSLYPMGDDIEKSQANFFSADTTTVMSYIPNDYGLYDMVGNVYEWCQDWYGYNYYEISIQEPENPKGPLQGVYRVLRGGCWKSLKEDLRCSRRHRNNPGTVNGTYGFRCAADVQ